jgi:hypothetical protein
MKAAPLVAISTGGWPTFYAFCKGGNSSGRENPAPEGRTKLAQHFSAGKREKAIQVPEGRPPIP